MSFARTEFLLFLAILVAAFPFVPARGRQAALLMASVAFYLYASTWHLLVLGLSIALDFGVGLALGGARSERWRRALLLLSVLGNLGLLIAFKYAGASGLSTEGVGYLGQPMHVGLDLVVPLGISFYTFQSLGYSIDVYRRRIEPCRDPLEFALFVAFFPQLVAGPIERAGHLLPQLSRLRVPTRDDLVAGLDRILFGLVKKLVLADRFRWPLMAVLDQPQDHDALTLVTAGFGLFALLYLDFSAYTDLAIGTARLFGVRLVENFDRPHLARTVSDFTRRWHMSLVRWIGEYVHEPLIGRRLTHRRLWLVNALVMGLFGVWHGPRWNYLLGGLLLGVVISCEQSWRLAGVRAGRRRRARPRRWLQVMAWAGTMTLWAFFAVALFSPDLSTVVEYVREIGAWRGPNVEGWRFGGLVLGLCGAGLALQALGPRLGSLGAGDRSVLPRFGLATGLLLLAAVPDPTDFVYFQF